MRQFTRLFFTVGAFIFLYWYMPVALSDNKVTLFEMFAIWINGFALIVNPYKIITEATK